MARVSILDATPLTRLHNGKGNPENLVNGTAWNWLEKYGYVEGVTDEDGIAAIERSDMPRLLAGNGVVSDDNPITTRTTLSSLAS